MGLDQKTLVSNRCHPPESVAWESILSKPHIIQVQIVNFSEKKNSFSIFWWFTPLTSLSTFLIYIYMGSMIPPVYTSTPNSPFLWLHWFFLSCIRIFTTSDVTFHLDYFKNFWFLLRIQKRRFSIPKQLRTIFKDGPNALYVITFSFCQNFGVLPIAGTKNNPWMQ